MIEGTKRHYEEPPLEEAIFELFVPPAAPWSQAHGEKLAELFRRPQGSVKNLKTSTSSSSSVRANRWRSE